MVRGQPRRQIAEERRQFGVDLEPVIDRAHPRHVLLPHLLGQDEAIPQRGSSRSIAPGTISVITRAPWLPPTTSSRNGPLGSGDVFHGGRREDRGAHRRADGGGLARKLWIAIEHARQRGRNRADAAGQKTVGAPEHRVGVVNDAGHAAEPLPPAAAAASDSRRSRPRPQASGGASDWRNGGADGEHATRCRPATIGERPRTVSLGTTSIMSLENNPL